MLAYTGGTMRLAGWWHPVVADLAGLSIPSQNRPIRFGHDASSGVGHTDAIRVESGQLVTRGVVSRDTAAAREIVVSSRNGFPWQASIGDVGLNDAGPSCRGASAGRGAAGEGRAGCGSS